LTVSVVSNRLLALTTSDAVFVQVPCPSLPSLRWTALPFPLGLLVFSVPADHSLKNDKRW